MRPGTENVPGAVGLAQAAALAFVRFEEYSQQMKHLRDRLIHGAMALGPSSLNGCATRRLCNHASLNFPGISGAELVRGLAERGVCASAGAACHAGHSSGPSAVLKAIGHIADKGTVRFSVSRFTSDEDIDRALEALAALWRPPGL
jgi:cysteine desulfurase